MALYFPLVSDSFWMQWLRWKRLRLMKVSSLNRCSLDIALYATAAFFSCSRPHKSTSVNTDPTRLCS